MAVIKSLNDQTTEDVFHGIDSKAAREIPKTLWELAQKKLDMLNAAHEPRDLMVPPGNRLEKLKGNLSGFYSIRRNDQYRIIFKWSDGNVTDVQIIDYH